MLPRATTSRNPSSKIFAMLSSSEIRWLQCTDQVLQNTPTSTDPDKNPPLSPFPLPSPFPSFPFPPLLRDSHGLIEFGGGSPLQHAHSVGLGWLLWLPTLLGSHLLVRLLELHISSWVIPSTGREWLRALPRVSCNGR